MRLGMIPGGDSGPAGDRAAALAAALGALLGTTVEVHQAADYRVLLSAMEQGIAHFAWMPPLTAARGVASGCLAPAAVSVRNGSTSYLTGLITMKESPLRTLSDLRSVRVAWVDRESASGYLVIRAALRNAGVSLVSAFSEELFVRSHGEVARAVHTGRVDVGATCFNFVSGTFEIARSGYSAVGGLSNDEIRILAHAGPIPSDIFAVQRSVPPSVVGLVQSALVDTRPLKVHELARGLAHADSFIRPTPEHLGMLRELLQLLEGTRGSSILPPGR